LSVDVTLAATLISLLSGRGNVCSFLPTCGCSLLSVSSTAWRRDLPKLGWMSCGLLRRRSGLGADSAGLGVVLATVGFHGGVVI
jgi:hypothetical protein